MNRILIVDDEQDILETLQLILEMEGYLIDTASTGQQALEKMSAVEPDLVLSDVMMPVMNGIELLKRLKAHPQYRAIPVIISSAGDIDAQALRGCDAFLKKPVDLDVLVQTVVRVLGR
jgi:CheY-like chemotaxis protein